MTAYRYGARPVGDLLAGVMDPVLARKTGMTMGLIAAWSDIAGSRLAGACRPERLSWPPGGRGGEAALASATLVVACDGAAALRLQHQAPELLARVNAFFGYAAVARLKIVQKRVGEARPDRRPVLRPLEARETEDIRVMTAGIEDERLRAALAAFGAAVLGRLPMTKP